MCVTLATRNPVYAWCMASWLTAFNADHWEMRVWFPAEPPAEQRSRTESLFPVPP